MNNLLSGKEKYGAPFWPDSRNSLQPFGGQKPPKMEVKCFQSMDFSRQSIDVTPTKCKFVRKRGRPRHTWTNMVFKHAVDAAGSLQNLRTTLASSSASTWTEIVEKYVLFNPHPNGCWQFMFLLMRCRGVGCVCVCELRRHLLGASC